MFDSRSLMTVCQKEKMGEREILRERREGHGKRKREIVYQQRTEIERVSCRRISAIQHLL